jgi:hypothetical protein
MALYTFHPCLENGTSLTFETHDLAGMTEVARKAIAVLDAHTSAAYVVAWLGEEKVLTHKRIRPHVRT